MRSALAALLIPIACSTAAAASAQTVSDGLSAYMTNRIPEARRIYEAIAADPTAKAADRAAAGRELARIAFLIEGDNLAAMTRLDAAQALGVEGCETAALAARVLRAGGQADPADARAEAHLAECAQPATRNALIMQMVDARLDRAFQADIPTRPMRLARVDAALDMLPAEARTTGEAAAARLQMALIGQNANAAVAAWRDYFWLSDQDGPQALAALHPVEILRRGVDVRAGRAERLAVVDLLVRTGFAQSAQRFAAVAGLAEADPADPIWRRAKAYFAARDAIDAAALTVDRDLAHGQSKADKRLEQAVRKAMGEMLAAAGLTAKDKDDPRPELVTAYGLYGSVGDTGGYPSAHLGHVVEDRRLQVDQYGRHTEVRFIVLENMLQNGFESWLWDGRAAAGGWSGDDVIVQVRSGYAARPLRSAALIKGGPRRIEEEARQPERAAEDLARLKTREVSYLPGLADRLMWQIVDQIAGVARAKAGPNGDLTRAFLDEYWRGNVQHSIEMHEGRHALDKTFAKGLKAPELEYRAKLSELALSDYPRMALWNIDADTIEGDTPHGLANARIMTAYGAWTKAHAAEVAGYDPALPALVQLDKLTDAQIRTVARSLDAWAK